MISEAELLDETRFIFMRAREPTQRKGPLQLNLFVPYEYGYPFRVLLTNAAFFFARKLLALHNGRGTEEAIFVELKSQTPMDYVPAGTASPTKPGFSHRLGQRRDRRLRGGDNHCRHHAGRACHRN